MLVVSAWFAVGAVTGRVGRRRALTVIAIAVVIAAAATTAWFAGAQSINF